MIFILIPYLRKYIRPEIQKAVSYKRDIAIFWGHPLGYPVGADRMA